MVIRKKAKQNLLRQTLRGRKRLQKSTEKREEKAGNEPIAVIGIGCRLPGGIATPEEFWQVLVSGQDMIQPMTEIRRNAFYREQSQSEYQQKAGFLQEDIDALDYRLFRLPPAEAARLDPQQKMLLKVCWEALEDAGYAPTSLRHSATGVFVGVSLLDFAQALRQHQKVCHSFQPHDLTGSGLSFFSGRLSYYYGFRGPSITLDTACSSSLVAVAQACQALLAKECTMAIAGGVNLLYDPETTEQLAELNILSPTCCLRTFDAEADGTVRGEGCGLVVLKPLSRAKADGDRIYAVIRGCGVNQDGPSSGLTAPYGPAQEELLSQTWEKCGLDSCQIGYVEAHGTGTALGDPIELTALGNCLTSERSRPLSVGTVKTQLGHLEAAAGVAGLIKSILAVRYGQIPGNLHFKTPSPYMDWGRYPLRVPTVTQDWEREEGQLRRAGISSFGLSGTNAHVVVEEYEAELTEKSTATVLPLWPIKVSAPHKQGLQDQLKQLAAHVETQVVAGAFDLPSFSYSYNTAKADLPERIGLCARSGEELKRQLRSLLQGQAVEGVEYGKETATLIFLFSGQGGQYPGMGRELYQSNSSFRQAVRDCSRLYRKRTGRELLPILFGEQEDIHQTRFTQPGLFTLQYALGKMWESYGIRPDGLLGHSIGEYAAACLAGVFSLEDAMCLVVARGELMYCLPQDGSMLAVAAGREECLKWISPYKRLAVAASNTPGQTVISGDSTELEDLRLRLEKQDIRNRFLQVSHAFHSPLMKPMLTDFAAVARKIRYAEPVIDFYSALTGRKVGMGELSCPDYWIRHVEEEVRFWEALAAIPDQSHCAFLEIGPSPVLTAFAESAAEDTAVCLPSQVPGENGQSRVWQTLCSLYVQGASVDWRAVYAEYGLRRVLVPSYHFRQTHLGLEPVALSGQNKPPVQTALLREEEEPAESVFSPDGKVRFSEAASAREYVKEQIAQVLGVPVAEIDDRQNLLLLGMNSIAAARLAGKWRRVTGVALPVSKFLQDCTVTAWGDILFQAAQNESKEELAEEGFWQEYPEERYTPFALNEVQHAYWIGRNAELDWSGVACYAVLEMDVASLDKEVFTRALTALIQRHDMLRVRIQTDGTQQVLPEIKLPLTVYSRQEITNMETHLQRVREEMSRQILPLTGSLFELRLTEKEAGSWRIHFGIDFLIADALSVFIFWQDLSALYAQEVLPPLTVSYRDYVLYQQAKKQGAAYRAAQVYWQKQCQDFPDMPALPVRTGAEVQKDARFVRRQHKLSSAVWENFVRKAAQQGLTASAALLALYSEVLSAWGGGSRFGITVTMFEREEVHPQMQEVIGDFTRLLLLAAERRQHSVGENGRLLQTRLQADMEHSAYSATEVVKFLQQERGQEAFYPVVFTSALGLPGVEQADRSFLKDVVWTVSSTPQVWLDHQVYEDKKGIVLSWDAREAVFLPGVLDDMFACYVQLVERAAQEESFWDTCLTDLRPQEQQTCHRAVNQTHTQEQDFHLLHSFLQNPETFCPEAEAVCCQGESYTYGKLWEQTQKVAGFLQQQGIRPGELVGVHMAKSCRQVAAVLGILACGGVYVPLSYGQPAARTAGILSSTESRILLTDRELPLPENIQQWGSAAWEQTTAEFVWAPRSPEELAYVIFTSGSTGVPKGVCMTHKAVQNTLVAVNRKIRVTSQDVILGLSALSFDLSVYDIFGICSAGGRLVLPTEEERIDPKCLRALVREHEVTIWNSVPALLEIFLEAAAAEKNIFPSVRQVLLSGDWIPLSLFPKLRQVMPNAELLAMGGATEAAIWSNYYSVTQIEQDWTSIPYGYPLENQQFYILDEFGRSCPAGVQGRLHIGGLGLAQGYWRAPELTQAAFFHHSLLDQQLYDTGDYGRYDRQGKIEFLGRKDKQLKISGYRVELGDIEAAFARAKIADRVVILPVGEKMGSKKLQAYVQAAPEDFSEGKCKQALREQLPSYLIPERIIPVAEWPVTANGKIDSRALLKMTAAAEEKMDKTTDSPVLTVIREGLGMPDLQAGQNFGELGVSSVDMIRLANKLELVYGNRPSVGEMMHYRTVSELLAYYKERFPSSSSTVKEETSLRVIPLTARQLNYAAALPTGSQLPAEAAEELLPAPITGEIWQEWMQAMDWQRAEGLECWLVIPPPGIPELAAGGYRLTAEGWQPCPAAENLMSKEQSACLHLHVLADLSAAVPRYEKELLKVSYMQAGRLLERLADVISEEGWQVKEVPAKVQELPEQYYHLVALRLGRKSQLDDNQQEQARQLLQLCAESDIRLWVEGMQLKFQAPAGRLTSELQNKLREHKLILLHYLREHPDRKRFPLTPIQLAYVMGRDANYELGGTGAHYYAEFDCREIDVRRLEVAVNQVIEAHEMLRTIVYAQGEQEVLSVVPRFKIEVYEQQDEQELEKRRAVWSHQVYPLGEWPFFRIAVSHKAAGQVRLHFSFDCLLLDGWSAQLLFREIFHVYQGHKAKRPGFTFREYVAAEQSLAGSAVQTAKQYWLSKLKQLPPAPGLPLQTDLRNIQKPVFSRLQQVLSREETQNLERKIRQYRLTPSAVLCAAYLYVLSCWSGQEKLTVNVTLFNRLPVHEEVGRILGDFTNIALIERQGEGATWLDEVRAVQENFWQALEYRSFNGVELLRQLGQNRPGQAIMPVVFTSLFFGSDSQEDLDILLPGMEEGYAISQTPQVILDHQAYKRQGKIHLIWDFVAQALGQKESEEWFAAYGQILSALAYKEDWRQPTRNLFTEPRRQELKGSSV